MELIDFNHGRWAPATRASYAISWADFAKWGGDLPAAPQTIADFLTARAETLATSTLSGRLAAIVAVHSLYGHKIDVRGTVIKDAWAEIRRQKGTAKIPKAALAVTDMRLVMAGVPEDRLQVRAVLLVGFASAMRRSELVALNRDELAFTADGVTITIRRSKTDKSGKGEQIAIHRSGSPLCAVGALERWLEKCPPSGPVFWGRDMQRMQARQVATITKRWAANAGYPARDIGAHSLRRGCITSMFRAGADLKSIMSHSRHRTSDIALGYVQAETAQRNPAIKMIVL